MAATPLISVIVITYNSALYVEETLESIKNQTYAEIELIISDDFSTDGTVGVCKEWLRINKDRFAGVKLVSAQKNAGIPANCNNGLQAASGEWVKIIAGDDALFPAAIEHAVKFMAENKEARVFASSFTSFQNELTDENIQARRNDSQLSFYQLKAERQYFLLLRNNYIHAGTVFIQRSLLLETGGFIEKYRLLEDHPLWLNISKRKERFFYMPEYTLKYRLHGNSVFSHTGEEKLFNNFYLKRRGFELDMIYPGLRWYEKISYSYEFYLKRIFDLLGMNRKSKICSGAFELFRSFSPAAIRMLVQKKRLSNL